MFKICFAKDTNIIFPNTIITILLYIAKNL